jgi:N-acetylglucosaminyldiphosphoundecaprenol N-acetyl-beta-D-mannosaminyltransferase
MKKINFSGVEIEAITFNVMLNRVEGWLSNKNERSHHIACLNTYCISLALDDEYLQAIYNNADIKGPDGMPFVWWLRLFTKHSCDRLTAPNILLKLAENSKVKQYTFYLYGGAPDVVVNMKKYLEKRFPHIRIVGCYSPPFRKLTEAEDKNIVNEIINLQPDIIAVGLGTPKQDYWIKEHLDRIRGSVMIASGATFDYFGGRIKMAPPFIQNSGFEWLYRLFSKDIKRLLRRYTLLHIKFLWSFFLHLLKIKYRYPKNTF